MHTESIPYIEDITLFFNKLHKENRAILLDSGKPQSINGRYDILSAWPEQEIAIYPQAIKYCDSDKNNHVLNGIEDVIRLLQASKKANNSPLPFTGGWMGLASYELLHRLESHVSPPKKQSELPLFFAAYYDWAIIQDHQEKQTYLIYEKSIKKDKLEQIQALIHSSPANIADDFTINKYFSSHTDFASYQKQFNHIQAYLDAGDCYQVNLAMKFTTQFSGSTFTAYQQLRKAVPVDKMCYLNLDTHQILSISPESYLSAQHQTVTTRPIKGTAPRHSQPEQDALAAENLQKSVKNRAENLMIVDLLRNDFGKFCETGSVKTDALFTIESYANVHHLVSTISGKLRKENTIWSLFFGAFPGGSITGAPKIRACEIIQELEPELREIYCGSIFYASNNDNFDASIAIRTLLCHQQEISVWAGGGIVKDSTCQEEYEECHHKISLLLKSLESH